ncbi:hypothetical protein G3I76_38970, partial [Streptomyces sp. SID11233]|nr:hypothetical protein [Streptomyces sp. SID11233]
DVVTRHAPLRTVFPAVEGVPYQRVLTPDEAAVPLAAVRYEDLAAEAARPFDLSRDLPLRAALAPTGPGEHVLL